MNELVLHGCTPTPLANYLKALGVLRLLAMRDPETRGCWRNDEFVLYTTLDRAGVERFFLEEYEPTPIMAPWNGGSGFYAKDNKKALQAIQKSNGKRLLTYRLCLNAAEQVLNGMGVNRQASPKDEAKVALLTGIRSQMPDEVLEWFDATVSLSGDAVRYPPLLGTGGNDGRLDFTNNFMQRVLDVLADGNRTLSRQWLDMSLFGKPAPMLSKNAIGQFSPGQAGGPNAGTGFEADAVINPWDFVLMIEGALMYAAAVVRRNAEDPAGAMSYPFTVRAVSAGAGILGEGDAANARGELWMPLWRQPASFTEVRALMAEGRVAWKRKPVRDGLDFVRAVQSLGGYRGIQSFQRYGLLMRSGKAYLATPLSRIEVSDKPQSRWLDELDQHQWLDRFRQFACSELAADRFHVLRKRLEDWLFALSGHEPSKAEAQSLLILLGEIQAALSNSSKAMEAVRPVPRLSECWVMKADDGTPAFRIAKALAGLRGVGDEPLPLLAQFFPVQRKYNRWMTSDANEKARIYTGRNARPIDTLRSLLERRLWLAEKLEMPDKPLSSSAGATLDDVIAFLRDDAMDARIAALLQGLCLCDIPRDTDRSAGEGELPAAFGLLKLALMPDATLRNLGWLGEPDHLPLPAGMLAQLAAGNHDNRAVKIAWRRLRASGLSSVFSANALPELKGIDCRRAAAALLIPLRYSAVGRLARRVFQADQSHHQKEEYV